MPEINAVAHSMYQLGQTEGRRDRERGSQRTIHAVRELAAGHYTTGWLKPTQPNSTRMGLLDAWPRMFRAFFDGYSLEGPDVRGYRAQRPDFQEPSVD